MILWVGYVFHCRFLLMLARGDLRSWSIFDAASSCSFGVVFDWLMVDFGLLSKLGVSIFGCLQVAPFSGWLCLRHHSIRELSVGFVLWILVGRSFLLRDRELMSSCKFLGRLLCILWCAGSFLGMP
jgi:hypothetical protein